MMREKRMSCANSIWTDGRRNWNENFVMIVTAPVILVMTIFIWLCTGLPLAAIWLLCKVQSLKYVIQELVCG